MTLRIFSTDMDSDSALSQYESLRIQILNRPDFFPERSLGLAQFIRRGMLAWIDICHRCISVNPNQEKGPVIAAFSDRTTSEMIKVMANITLFNLEEALS